MGVLDEPVEDGVGDGRVGDDAVPKLERQLAGDDGGAKHRPVVDHLEKVAAFSRGEGREAPIVEDDKVGPSQLRQGARVGAVPLRSIKVLG